MVFPQVSIKDVLLKLLFMLFTPREHPQIEQATQFQGCRLNVTNGTTLGNIPVILNTEGPKLTLELPYNETINIQTSQKVLLLCPGLKNVLINTNNSKDEATCEGSKLKIGEQLYDFETVKCKKPVSADIIETKNQCAHKSKELLIGYKFEAVKEQDFIKLIKVCYNETNTTTLYTEHTIYGNNIKYFTRSTLRPFFSIRGMGADNFTSHGYKMFMQRSVFNFLLGSDKLASKYVNTRSFISRGHLAPHADFLLSNTQRSSYFYVNACPQWQSINGGNWNTLEMAIRKAAEVFNKTLTIFTGTYDVLDLPNKKNESVLIYLGYDYKLPVPKYVWKIVYDPETKDGIALINYNNPFVKSTEGIEFCENICKKYGWYWKNWNKFKKGYIFCCEIQQLREVVEYVPKLEVQGIIPGIFLKLV